VKALAVTGVGLVSPLGLGFAAFREALAQRAALGLEGGAAADGGFRRQSSVLSPDKIPDPVVAEVWNFDPAPFLGSKGLRNHDRLTLFMLVASRLTLEDAGLKRAGAHLHYGPDRIGVCSATAYGSLDSITELVSASQQDPHFVNPNRFPNTVINSAAAYVSIWEDLRAPNVTVVDGNCGALDAVLTSETHLRNGRADAFLVGGGEVLSDSLYLAFRKLGALAEGSRCYRPGHAESQGMRIGEGAAYFVLERVAGAAARGARSYGRILGYGNTFEPPQSEAALVHASQRAVERVIEMALSDAGLPAAAIDLVCASVSGFAPFDRAELAAVRSVLGREVAVVAPQAWCGETFGAGGAFGIATALAWLDGVEVPALEGASAAARRDHVLVIALGFYGNASAVVVAR
jgi:3-oxoacyl-[acyl-carrier-protein] synthase II